MLATGTLMKVNGAVYCTDRAFVQVDIWMCHCGAKLGYCAGIRFEGMNRRARHHLQHLNGGLSAVSTHLYNDWILLPDTPSDITCLQSSRGDGKDHGICHVLRSPITEPAAR